MSRRAAKLVVLATLSFALISAVAASAVFGAFLKSTANAGNTITAATDFVAPEVTASVISKSTGGVAGLIKKAGTYYVYANVEDAGNPSSGLKTVTANVTTITSGTTAASLSAGTYEVEGVEYNRRSAKLTAGSSLAAGSYSYSVTAKDVSGNSATESGFSVEVDNTVPAAADVQTTNGGAIAGRPDIGDKITLTLTKEIEPETVLAGWTGPSTSVVVRVNNVEAADTVTIYNSTNKTLLPLGTISLGRTDYTTANITFGASGTASTMTMSGNQIMIVLGTQSAAGTTAASTGTMTWTPVATPTDFAGNAVSTTAKTESGSADKDF
ncbi:MAG TPA: hypothetical protein VMT37_00050 [Solirubrobacterales bacterium]|nr:hypothetical protein [Solirubrobacterales bacterium]